MRLHSYHLIVIFTLFFTVFIFAQEKRTIAVISIQAYEGISQGEAEILTDRLRTELVNTNVFTVMEREEMQEILTEQSFQLTGCTSNECMVQAGRILGVKEIIGGSVGKFGDIYTVTVRIINVESGQILNSGTDDVGTNMTDLLTISMKKLANELAEIDSQEVQVVPNEITVAEEKSTYVLDTIGVKICEDSELYLVEKDGMVLLPGGEFLMGSENGDEDEKPIHAVKINPFWIDKYEVTVLDFRKNFNNAIEFPKQPDWNTDNCPIVNIPHWIAQSYAKLIVKRLPTEAEWEYAAKGGLDIEYPWGSGNPSDFANLKGIDGRDTWNKTSPVGSFPPNRFGLYDMAGNVREWCRDEYKKDFYMYSSYENPVDIVGKSPKYWDPVCRGGSYRDSAYHLRCQCRNHNKWGWGNKYIGFRCARDAAPEEIEYYITNNPNYGKPKQR